MAGLQVFTFVLLVIALANARVTKNTPGNSARLRIKNTDQLAEEHSGQFEGDMILSEDQKLSLFSYKRNGLIATTYRWSNNIVPVVIHEEEFTPELVEQIKKAMAKIESVSCVRFVPIEYEHTAYVRVIGTGSGCYSSVGRRGGEQKLNLEAPGCFRLGTIIHEFLHTLGFFHQHSASNRDEFVDILWENIENGRDGSFRKYNSATVTDYDVGYDYGSVLHYSSTAFSKNGEKTIVPKDSKVIIGQRVGMSEKDIAKLNKMYQCSNNSAGTAPSNPARKANKRRIL